ncbi:hypothetical protein [Thalassotalea atypica]|uniref:hypothetical protein n=1 Tax=Thalassotalea atypica TaxID=2054316 RepID=UPI002573A6B4|nr:hypothetical protein [Thalassotalea atypica]
MSKLFIPTNFKIPISFDVKDFHICPLDRNVAELDFEAVMSCHNELRGVFGPNDSWPKPHMTLADSIASLLVHEDEFKNREAFAYSVLTTDKNICLGSIYIDPCNLKQYECEVYFWVRSDRIDLENKLFAFISSWLQKEWPFKNVVYPGRSVSWKNWEQQLKVV